MPAKLSLVIAAKNCADRIEGTIRPWTDSGLASEVVVVDQFSTDGSDEIARKLGAKVIQNEPPGGNFNLNRRLGLEKSTGDWLLYMDTDERPTPALLQEMREFLNGPGMDPKIEGAKIPNLFYFLGRPLKHGLYSPRGAELRLFRQGKWHYPTEHSVHQGVSVQGKVLRFKHAYKHFNVNSLYEWFVKTNQYTEFEVTYQLKTGALQKMPERKLGAAIDAIRFFCRHFFWKLGFLDGFAGFVSIVYFALYHFTLEAKRWEKRELLRLNEGEDYIRPLIVPQR